MPTQQYTNEVFLGTEVKINISVAPIAGVTMDNYDFFAEFYCSAKRVSQIDKKDAIRIDESNYVFRLDTSILGAGDLKCKFTAFIPDSDFPDGLRTEVKGIYTDIKIVKHI